MMPLFKGDAKWNWEELLNFKRFDIKLSSFEDWRLQNKIRVRFTMSSPNKFKETLKIVR